MAGISEFLRRICPNRRRWFSSRVIDRGHSLHFSYKDEFVILTGCLILSIFLTPPGPMLPLDPGVFNEFFIMPFTSLIKEYCGFRKLQAKCYLGYCILSLFSFFVCNLKIKLFELDAKVRFCFASWIWILERLLRHFLTFFFINEWPCL